MIRIIMYLFLAVIFAWLPSCQLIKIPEFKHYDHLVIDKIGFNHSKISVDLHFYNPNNLSIVLDNAELDIYINNHILGHSSQKYRQVLANKTQFVIPIKFDIEMKNILQNSWATLINKEVDIKIKGKIKIGKGKIFTSFPVDYSTKQTFDLF